METQTAPNAGDGATQVAQPVPGDATRASTANEAGTTSEGVQLQQDGAKVSLDELIKQYPHLSQEIESKYVSPHLKRMEQGRAKLEKEIEDRVLARTERDRLQAQSAALLEKSRSPDENVRNQALIELGKLHAAQAASAQQTQALEQERQRVRTEMATNFARDVLKIDPTSIPQEVLGDDEKFAEFAWSNSPRTKQMEAALKEQLGKMNQDANAVAEANAAAEFGTRLQTTPSPTTGGGGVAEGAQTQPVSKAEWDKFRSNPEWRQRNEKRILAGMATGSLYR